jgi:creatinine amidohydrolase
LNGGGSGDRASGGGVHELAALSWPAVAALERARCVALLPVGALEAHGPHLPLATDVLIADAMARDGARRLADAGGVVLLLPALSYTPAPFAAGFAGTLSLLPATLTALIVDVGRALATHDVRVLAIANAHLDPAHLGALHAAAAPLADAGVTYVFPDITRRPLAQRLTDEFRSGACHAGRFETSIILATRPDLVDDAARAALPPCDRSLSLAIREGKRTFEEAGGARAYFGDPAAASVAEGRASVAELGRILEEAVVAALSARP